jgi:hypothetical protein
VAVTGSRGLEGRWEAVIGQVGICGIQVTRAPYHLTGVAAYDVRSWQPRLRTLLDLSIHTLSAQLARSPFPQPEAQSKTDGHRGCGIHLPQQVLRSLSEVSNEAHSTFCGLTGSGCICHYNLYLERTQLIHERVLAGGRVIICRNEETKQQTKC